MVLSPFRKPNWVSDNLLLFSKNHSRRFLMRRSTTLNKVLESAMAPGAESSRPERAKEISSQENGASNGLDEKEGEPASLTSSKVGAERGGHSESKGAKKRDKSVSGNGNTKPTRGVATSFGFRRRPASTSRADDNARRKKAQDKNGNAGSTEDLRVEDVLVGGGQLPWPRPRKENGRNR
ncbi:hypothetical protein evm_012639 [Chilo suppressalis]|nr:hypothetical protein evm_012639 [Chilo suppressalis]